MTGAPETTSQCPPIYPVVRPSKGRKRRITPVGRNTSPHEALLAMARLLGRQAALEASRFGLLDSPTKEMEPIR